MKILVCGIVAFLALPSLQSQALAKTITYTFSGTVSFSESNRGDFNNANIAGAAFTDTETFDLSLAPPVVAQGSISVFSGSENNGPVIGSSSLTVVGFPTILFTGKYYSSLSYIPKSYTLETQTVGTDTGPALQDVSFAAILPPSVTDPFLPVSLAISSGNGTYENKLNGLYTVTELEVTGLTITSSDVSAVPLPASLPLFGGALLTLTAFGYGAARRPWKSKAPAAT